MLLRKKPPQHTPYKTINYTIANNFMSSTHDYYLETTLHISEDLRHSKIAKKTRCTVHTPTLSGKYIFRSPAEDLVYRYGNEAEGLVY